MKSSNRRRIQTFFVVVRPIIEPFVIVRDRIVATGTSYIDLTILLSGKVRFGLYVTPIILTSIHSFTCCFGLQVTQEIHSFAWVLRSRQSVS